MRKRIHIIPIVLILILILFMAGKQLVADFYYSMARKDGRDPNKAIRYLENCILIDKKNPSFHFTLGREFLRKGLAKAVKRNEKSRWLRESIYEFRKAIDLKPSSSDYHFHLGINYGSLGYPPFFYWKIIQNSFERTMMLNSTDVRHLYFIGVYYLNEYQKLKHMGWPIEEKGPANKENYLTISRDNYQLYFRKMGDVDEGYLGKILNACFSVTQDYVDLRSLIGDTARSHLILARFLHSKGMWEEAKNQYMIAINLEPLNPIYYAEFANAFSSRMDFENAITWWQKQKMVNPQDERIYLSLSYGFMRLNRFDDALRELHELIKLNPENINYRIKLIRTLLVARRLDEAVDEYRKVMGKTKSFSESSYEKIRQYQRKGDYPEAIRILNEALVSAVNR